MSTEFQDFLQDIDNGIFWQSGPRNTPNYNALVERNIQTKKAMVRALHLQSQLSEGYWPLTSSAARFILNRLPRTTNAGMITPYQAYFGRAPELSPMQMFGCT